MFTISYEYGKLWLMYVMNIIDYASCAYEYSVNSIAFYFYALEHAFLNYDHSWEAYNSSKNE